MALGARNVGDADEVLLNVTVLPAVWLQVAPLSELVPDRVTVLLPFTVWSTPALTVTLGGVGRGFVTGGGGVGGGVVACTLVATVHPASSTNRHHPLRTECRCRITGSGWRILCMKNRKNDTKKDGCFAALSDPWTPSIPLDALDLPVALYLVRR